MPLEGYKRTSGIELLLAVSRAMESFPNQRLGQIIVNAIPVGSNIFNIYDEDLCKYLNDYCDNYGGK